MGADLYMEYQMSAPDNLNKCEKKVERLKFKIMRLEADIERWKTATEEARRELSLIRSGGFK